MTDIREVINPSDKITIDCSDLDAARVAVLVLGLGWYVIKDDDMPILGLGGSGEFFRETYGKSMAEFFDAMDGERLAKALDSVAMVEERTSLNDIVARARSSSVALRGQS